MRVCIMLCMSVAMLLITASAFAADDRFTCHGVAAPVSECRGVIASQTANGKPLIVAFALDMNKGAGRGSLLLIDAQTGRTQQFWYPDKQRGLSSNFAAMVAKSRKIYLTFGTTFLEFDPDKKAWTFAKKMPIGRAEALVEDEKGVIYAGTLSTQAARIWRFNPATRAFDDLGPSEPKETMTGRIEVDSKGWIYTSHGPAKSNLMAFNPATGERRQLVDEKLRKRGYGYVNVGVDGHIYGRGAYKAPWLRLFDGKGAEVKKAPKWLSRPKINWQEQFVNFPCGGRVTDFDLPNRKYVYVGPDGNKNPMRFEYESGGAGITYMREGPGDKVYGSACHPFRLFTVDGAGKLTDLGGLKRVGGGNFRGLASVGNTVYAGEYSGGRLWAYDTTKPWNDSGDDQGNPKVLGKFYEPLGRPRAMIAHPDGRRVLLAGLPGYGVHAGGLLFYDVVDHKAVVLKNEDMLKGLSTITLSALHDGTVVGGTTIRVGFGHRPSAKGAEIFFMDPATHTITFHTAPIEGARDINCVRTGPDGRVYGLTNDARFFMFDPKRRTVLARLDLSEGGNALNPDQSVFIHNGQVYVLLHDALMQVDTQALKARKVADLPTSATAGLGVMKGRVYYAAGSEVWSSRLP